MARRDKDKRDHDSLERGDKLMGGAVIGCVAVGILALLAALGAINSNNWPGGGLCLIASALAFGAMLNALAR